MLFRKREGKRRGLRAGKLTFVHVWLGRRLPEALEGNIAALLNGQVLFSWIIVQVAVVIISRLVLLLLLPGVRLFEQSVEHASFIVRRGADGIVGVAVVVVVNIFIVGATFEGLHSASVTMLVSCAPIIVVSEFIASISHLIAIQRASLVSERTCNRSLGPAFAHLLLLLLLSLLQFSV